MRKLLIYISLCAVLLIAFLAVSWRLESFSSLQQQTPVGIKLSAPVSQPVSAHGISIQLLNINPQVAPDHHLILSGTYGTTVLQPVETSGVWIFNVPAAITKRAGMVQWKLIVDQNILQNGEFQLLPQVKNLGALENYLGPRSIVANVRDYTMLVAIPTDSLDNMLPDGTQLSLNHQFKNQITKTPSQLEKGFAWQRIPSPLVTGRMSTGSTLEDISSLELVADVFPDVAVDFQLYLDQNHSYADGNEISTFQTSQIKDQHGNVMTDGTLVKFFMQDASGPQWQTIASTINGYAFAKAIHPQTPTTWKVKALIQGIAQSPELQVPFNTIINEIPIKISEDNAVVVGPLTSYLGQIIPDGIQVTMELQGNTEILLTEKGMARLPLEDTFNKLEDITVTTLGLTKTTKIGSLEKE